MISRASAVRPAPATPVHPAPLPSRHHDGGDGVAHEVHERKRFGHQPMNPQYERDARDRHRPQSPQGRRQHHKAGRPATPAAPFDANSSTANTISCWSGPAAYSSPAPGTPRRWLGKARPIQIERVARRNHQPHHRLLAPELPQPLHEPRQHRLGRGRRRDDHDLLTNVPQQPQQADPGPPGDCAEAPRTRTATTPRKTRVSAPRAVPASSSRTSPP